jgi:hypothetical protein
MSLKFFLCHREVFTELLPSNERRDTFYRGFAKQRIHIQTHRPMGGIYEVAVEMCPVAMIYIYIYIKFHKDWFSHSQADRRNSQTHSMAVS